MISFIAKVTHGSRPIALRRVESLPPSLFLAEVARGITRRTDNARMGQASIQSLMGFHDVKIVSIDDELALTAAELVVDCRLRGADAIYVALAHKLKAPLLSWNQEQIAPVQNVVKAGVPSMFFDNR